VSPQSTTLIVRAMNAKSVFSAGIHVGVVVAGRDTNFYLYWPNPIDCDTPTCLESVSSWSLDDSLILD